MSEQSLEQPTTFSPSLLSGQDLKAADFFPLKSTKWAEFETDDSFPQSLLL